MGDLLPLLAPFERRARATRLVVPVIAALGCLIGCGDVITQTSISGSVHGHTWSAPLAYGKRTTNGQEVFLTDTPSGCDHLGYLESGVAPAIWLHSKPDDILWPRTVELREATGPTIADGVTTRADEVTVFSQTAFPLTADGGLDPEGTAGGRFSATFGTEQISGTFVATVCSRLDP